MSESLFCANFGLSFSLFCRKFVQSWMRRFWTKNTEETTYGAYDGPSCLWQSVGGSVEKLLKEDGEVWPSVRLRSLWRSVLQVRREDQRSDPSTQIPRVEVFWNETLDGPLCLWRSVTLAVEGNEESSRRNCTKYGTTDSTTVRCDHDGPSRGPSTQPCFGRFPAIRIVVWLGFLFFYK